MKSGPTKQARDASLHPPSAPSERITTDLTSKQTFTSLIVTSVVDWASKVRSSKKKDAPKFEWSAEQRQYLQTLLNRSPDFLKTAPLKNSKLKNYILSIVENGISRNDIDTFYKYREQFPLNLIGLEINLSNFESNNKNQLLSTEQIESGFYMLEAQVASKPLSKIEYLAIKSLEPSHQFELRIEKHKTFKRLIYLSRTTDLMIEGKPKLPLDTLTHFKLVPITRHFFLSRLLKKIGASTTAKKIAHIDDDELMTLWDQYDKIFKQHKPTDAYEHFIEKIEPTIIPSKEKQLSHLKMWRIKSK